MTICMKSLASLMVISSDNTLLDCQSLGPRFDSRLVSILFTPLVYWFPNCSVYLPLACGCAHPSVCLAVCLPVRLSVHPELSENWCAVTMQHLNMCKGFYGFPIYIRSETKHRLNVWNTCTSEIVTKVWFPERLCWNCWHFSNCLPGCGTTRYWLVVLRKPSVLIF